LKIAAGAAISSSGAISDTLGVPSFVPKWRMGLSAEPALTADDGRQAKLKLGFPLLCL